VFHVSIFLLCLSHIRQLTVISMDWLTDRRQTYSLSTVCSFGLIVAVITRHTSAIQVQHVNSSIQPQYLHISSLNTLCVHSDPYMGTLQHLYGTPKPYTVHPGQELTCVHSRPYVDRQCTMLVITEQNNTDRLWDDVNDLWEAASIINLSL